MRPSDGKHPHDNRVHSVRRLPLLAGRDEGKALLLEDLLYVYREARDACAREISRYAKVHVFYIDVRTPGKSFDEFYRRAVEQYGVDYIKGMVGKVTR